MLYSCLNNSVKRAKKMSINNSEKYYGVVVLRILKALGEAIPTTTFSVKTGQSLSSFAIHGISPKTIGKGKICSIGLFIKISNKRVTPWSYSFDKVHQDEIAQLKKTHDQVFIAFVAADDGIACIDFEQLKELLDSRHEEQEWVRVSRKLHKTYRIKGNDGSLERPLPRNSFPMNIVRFFEDQLG